MAQILLFVNEATFNPIKSGSAVDVGFTWSPDRPVAITTDFSGSNLQFVSGSWIGTIVL